MEVDSLLPLTMMPVQDRHLRGALVNCPTCHLSQVRKCRPGEVPPNAEPSGQFVAEPRPEPGSLPWSLCPPTTGDELPSSLVGSHWHQ